MILRHILQALLAIHGLEKINNTLAEIFHSRYQDAMEDGRRDEAEVLDAISEAYDSINHSLTSAPFKEHSNEL